MPDAVAEYALQEEWDAWVHQYAWHLDKLPPLLQQMREQQATVIHAARLATRITGGGYPDNVRVIDEPGTPDADAARLWGMLTDYLDAVVDRIGECPWPRIPVVLSDEPREVGRVSYEAIAWLLEDDRVERVVEHHDLAALEDALFHEIRRGGGVYGLAPARKNTRRMCRVCGERAVEAKWIDEGAGTVSVARCERCGDTVRGEA